MLGIYKVFVIFFSLSVILVGLTPQSFSQAPTVCPTLGLTEQQARQKITELDFSLTPELLKFNKELANDLREQKIQAENCLLYFNSASIMPAPRMPYDICKNPRNDNACPVIFCDYGNAEDGEHEMELYLKDYEHFRGKNWVADQKLDTAQDNLEKFSNCIAFLKADYSIQKEFEKMVGDAEKKVTETVTSNAEQMADQIGKEVGESIAKQVVPDVSSKDCVIATASFGSPMAKEVQMLREIRDLQLMQTQSGSAFMDLFNTFYYSFAPTIAQWERDSPVFKEVVKTTITPLVASLSLLQYVNMDSEIEVLSYGISMIMLNVGMYFVAPAIVIWRIKKWTR